MCEAPSLSAVPASNHDSTSVTSVGPAPPTDSVVSVTVILILWVILIHGLGTG